MKKIALFLLVAAALAVAQFQITPMPYATLNLTVCPSDETINSQIAKGKEAGMGYTITYDDRQCRKVECTQTGCPTDAEINSYIERCKNAGYGYVLGYDERQ